jgi:hypothetical protein
MGMYFEDMTAVTVFLTANYAMFLGALQGAPVGG